MDNDNAPLNDAGECSADDLRFVQDEGRRLLDLYKSVKDENLRIAMLDLVKAISEAGGQKAR